jgi:hypothetical protein
MTAKMSQSVISWALPHISSASLHVIWGHSKTFNISLPLNAVAEITSNSDHWGEVIVPIYLTGQ